MQSKINCFPNCKIHLSRYDAIWFIVALWSCPVRVCTLFCSCMWSLWVLVLERCVKQAMTIKFIIVPVAHSIRCPIRHQRHKWIPFESLRYLNGHGKMLVQAPVVNIFLNWLTYRNIRRKGDPDLKPKESYKAVKLHGPAMCCKWGMRNYLHMHPNFISEQ